MKKIFSTILFFSLLHFSASAKTTCNDSISFLLREKIAQMFIVGFRGTDTKTSEVTQLVKDYKVGGIIFFEYDQPSGSRPRNITSQEQTKKLISDLQSISKVPLFVSIDQEGGRVNRLKKEYGFPVFPSLEYLGRLNNLDTTLYWAQTTGKILYELGFNMNFAPGVDVNINPNCPIIGRIGRSFSANPDIVTKHAATWIQGQTNEHVFSVIKHFPGHGSSSVDTHLDFSDVTNTWDTAELIPYKKLIAEKKCDFILTSHVMNMRIDSIYPATLSKNTVDSLLRKQLHFEGIIISDDMDMGAIKNNFSLKTALEKGISAGIDIFIYSNNGRVFNPIMTQEIISTVEQLVEEGAISEERINTSFERIMRVKGNL